MKRILLITTLLASPALADGPSTFVDPPVAKPRCVATFLFWSWETKCNAPIASGIDRDRNRTVILVDHVPPNNGHPDPERPQRTLGNPGNDKPVGRSGEKQDKGMAERGDAGNRGKSN